MRALRIKLLSMEELDAAQEENTSVASDFKERAGNAEKEIGEVFEKYAVRVAPHLVYSQDGIRAKIVFVDVKDIPKA